MRAPCFCGRAGGQHSGNLSRPLPDESLLTQLLRERWPLFRQPSPALEASQATQDGCGGIGIAFIDEGGATLSAFHTFLKTYRTLFLALDSVQLVYVSASDHRLAPAERAFARFRQQLAESMLDTRRLEEHFCDRLLVEKNNFSEFDQARLDRFRAGQRQFSGSFFDGLYRGWLTKGACDHPPMHSGRITFRTHHLQHNYDFFGSSEGR